MRKQTKSYSIEWDDGIVEEEGGESGTPSEGGETTVSSTLGAAYSTDAEYAKTVTTYTATN